jgi:transcription elongation factor GreA
LEPGNRIRSLVFLFFDQTDITMEKIPMTTAGFKALEEELRHRQQEERPRIIQAIAEARAHGDLSENAEYHSAKEQQSLNEGRIAELEDKISRAEVIDVSKLSGSTIKFGATVKLIDDDTDEEKTYQIVGDSEADVKDGKVSISSPIARALIGKKTGDSIEVNTPGGGKSYEIIDVLYR